MDKEQIQNTVVIEILYVRSNQHWKYLREVLLGTTVKEAILQCGILDEVPTLSLQSDAIGIFGELTSLDKQLIDGDRIEIYQNLLRDPKQARRDRALLWKKKKQEEKKRL